MSSISPQDGRVPVRFGTIADAGPGCALLIEGEAALADGHPTERFTVPGLFTAHPAGCPCCAARGSVARALSRLFLARARGDVPLFQEVIAVTASPRGEAAIRTALLSDPLASAWFRLLDCPPSGLSE